MSSSFSEIVDTTSFILVACKTAIYAILNVADESVVVSSIETVSQSSSGDAFGWQPTLLNTHQPQKTNVKVARHTTDPLTINEVTQKCSFNQAGTGTHRVVLIVPPVNSTNNSPVNECTITFNLSNGERLYREYNVIATRTNTKLLRTLQLHLLDQYDMIAETLEYYKDSSAFVDKIRSAKSHFDHPLLTKYLNRSKSDNNKRKIECEPMDKPQPKKRIINNNNLIVLNKVEFLDKEFLDKYALNV